MSKTVIASVDYERLLAENVAELSWALYGDSAFPRYYDAVRAELSDDISERDTIRDMVISFARILTDIERERDLYGEEGADWYILVDLLVSRILNERLYTASRELVLRLIEESKS